MNTRKVQRRLQLYALFLSVLAGGLLLAGRAGRLAAEGAANGPHRVYSPVVVLPAPPADELLAFDWNGPITEAHHGIPAPEPLPGANGDWTQPVNYAQGTIYLRVEVRSQPQPQSMRLQICWWQSGRETCTRAGRITGQPGAVTTWSQSVPRLWSANDVPVDWTKPRSNGIVIKDAQGHMVSDYGDWNWGGHDPAAWFPLDIRFTAVVVEPGGTFSGWERYIQ